MIKPNERLRRRLERLEARCPSSPAVEMNADELRAELARRGLPTRLFDHGDGAPAPSYDPDLWPFAKRRALATELRQAKLPWTWLDD